MNLDALDAAQRLGALVLATEIERAFDAERAQHRRIFFGEVAEMVGTKDLTPAHDAAVLAGIAAKVAEIAGTGEIEMAGRG